MTARILLIPGKARGHRGPADSNKSKQFDAGVSNRGKATPVKTATPQPLDGPPTFKVENGPVSGQLILKGKPVLRAVSYVVHYAPLGSDGKPGSWTELAPVTAIRSIVFNGLTAGTTYAFQVRALGRAGYTN